jgi:hypothetical protein
MELSHELPSAGEGMTYRDIAGAFAFLPAFAALPSDRAEGH